MLDSHAEFAGNNAIPAERIQAFIGNSEQKSIIQLLVEPGDTLTINSVNELFAGAQEPYDKVHFKGQNTLAISVSTAHAAAGTFDVTGELKVAEWSAQKALDSDLADSIAGQNLAFSRDYGLSLEHFWGITSTTPGRLRSPEVRLKIYEFLSTIEPGRSVNILQIAAATGLPRSLIQKHMQGLSEHGYIEYSATKVTEEAALFEINMDSDPTISTLTLHGERQRAAQKERRGLPTVRVQIGLFIRQLQDQGIDTFTYPELFASFINTPLPPVSLVSSTLGAMLREGIVTRRHKTTSQNKDEFSIIYLDEAQKSIIDRASAFSRGLRERQPDVIQQGLDYASTIMTNKLLVTQLLEKAYTLSFRRKATPHDQRASELESLLDGTEISTRQLQGLYEESNLGLRSIESILRRMRRERRVIGRKVGNEIFWSLTN